LPAARVWPFETGFDARADNDARVVLAEVYPSFFEVSVPKGAVRDAVQVESVAREFARLDASGAFALLLAGPRLSARDRQRVVTEECWMLGVT
jgi:hypothetical protein